jgi:hypothetical protein
MCERRADERTVDEQEHRCAGYLAHSDLDQLSPAEGLQCAASSLGEWCETSPPHGPITQAVVDAYLR